MSESFCDVGGGVTLCYEEFGDPGNPPVVLIMGLGTQMLGWHEAFCEELAFRGFHVVRFDNRDSGRSTHMTGRPPTLPQLINRRFGADQYTLADMADDTAGLIDALEISPAHVVGASMGGMIAQTLAARHPARVRSLVSIMSNSGSRLSGQPALRTYRQALKRAPSEREAYADHMVRLFRLVGSRGLPQDEDDLRDIALRSFDRDHDRAATGRQLGAILASGNRTRELRRIVAPTLVIHGTDDRLIMPSGGRATARAIPHARLLKIEGMGHDLPRAAWPRIIGAITEHAHQADRVPQAA